MAARDDYPKLDANTSGPHHQGQTSTEAQAALDEIDRLRNALIDHMAEFHNPQTALPDKRCSHLFPLPGWMSPDQEDPCRCDLDAGHEGAHSCEHLRAAAP